jgi:hypothetical protein
MLGLNDGLFAAIITDGFTGCRYTTRERCLTHHLSGPDFVKQLISGDYLIAMPKQIQ